MNALSVAVIPRLSIVMPVHRSEYLDEALRSVLAQSYRNIELVVVVDGDDDTVGAILAATVERDERVRVIRLEGRVGAGAARNLGVRAARAQLIAFADSDDVVPESAYEALIGAILASGDDVVSGRARQFFEDGTDKDYWTTDGLLHGAARRGLYVRSDPQLAGDHTPWNKVFRARTLRALGDEPFPEGVTSEDLVFWARASHGARVSVIPEVVYRHRRHGSSVTSALDRPQEIRDWADGLRQAIGIHRENAGDDAASWLLNRVFMREAWTRVRRMPESEAASWIELSGFVKWALDGASTETIDSISEVRRWSYMLLAAGRALACRDLQLLLRGDYDAWARWNNSEDVKSILGTDEHGRSVAFWREVLFFPTIREAERFEAPPTSLQPTLNFYDSWVREDANEHEAQVLRALRQADFALVATLRRVRQVRATVHVRVKLGRLVVQRIGLVGVPAGMDLQSRVVLIGVGAGKKTEPRTRFRPESLESVRVQLTSDGIPVSLIPAKILREGAR